jgi:hypothetical protein
LLTNLIMNIPKKAKLVIIFSVLSVFFADISFSITQKDQAQEDFILSAAENLFVYMKNKDYVSIWNCLSVKSKKIIVEDVYKESKKTGVEYKKNELLNDFNSGGRLAKAYWDSFLAVFDSSIALEQSKWEMGKIEKNEAEVTLKYKKSDKPAILKMYKENNAWRVGLKETFGAHDLNPF